LPYFYFSNFNGNTLPDLVGFIWFIFNRLADYCQKQGLTGTAALRCGVHSVASCSGVTSLFARNRLAGHAFHLFGNDLPGRGDAELEWSALS
jgi:hypothetical protein